MPFFLTNHNAPPNALDGFDDPPNEKGRGSTQAVLTSGISDVDTTIPVGDTSAFPTSFPFLIKIEDEIIQVGSKSPLQFTVCVRAQNGTSAAAHSAGTTAYLYDDDGSLTAEDGRARVWTRTPYFHAPCSLCDQKYDPGVNDDGCRGAAAFSYDIEVPGDSGTGFDLGYQDPGRLINAYLKIQRILQFFYRLGAYIPSADYIGQTGNFESYLGGNFSERRLLYCVSGGTGLTLTIKNEQAGHEDPRGMADLGGLMAGDIVSVGTLFDPSAFVISWNYSDPNTTILLSKILYIPDGASVALFRETNPPPYYGYPEPSTVEGRCVYCRIDYTDSVVSARTSMADTTVGYHGTGEYMGVAWFCLYADEASKVREFQPGICRQTDCSRYSPARRWPPITAHDVDRLLMARDQATDTADTTLYYRGFYDCPGLAFLIGSPVFYHWGFLGYSVVSYFGRNWGKMVGGTFVQGMFSADKDGVLKSSGNRLCFTGGLNADGTIQDAAHKNETMNQPLRRWPDLNISIQTNAPPDSPGDYGAQGLRQRDRMIPTIDRNRKDSVISTPWGTWEIHSTPETVQEPIGYDNGGGASTLSSDLTDVATAMFVADSTSFASSGRVKVGSEIIAYTGTETVPHTLTGLTRGVDGTTAAAHLTGAAVTNAAGGAQDVGLTITLDPGRVYPSRSPVFLSERTIAKATRTGGQLKLQFLPGPVDTAQVLTGPLRNEVTPILAAGGTVRPYESDRPTQPVCVHRAVAGDVYGLAQRGACVQVDDDDRVWTITRAEAHAGDTYDAAVWGALPALSFLNPANGALYGVLPSATPVGPSGSLPDIWNTDRLAMDCVWIDLDGEVDSDDWATLFAPGESVTFPWQAMIPPRKAWNGSTFTDTDFSVSVEWREFSDSGANVILEEGLDYYIRRSQGVVKVFDHVLAGKSTTDGCVLVRAPFLERSNDITAGTMASLTDAIQRVETCKIVVGERKKITLGVDDGADGIYLPATGEIGVDLQRQVLVNSNVVGLGGAFHRRFPDTNEKPSPAIPFAYDIPQFRSDPNTSYDRCPADTGYPTSDEYRWCEDSLACGWTPAYEMKTRFVIAGDDAGPFDIGAWVGFERLSPGGVGPPYRVSKILSRFTYCAQALSLTDGLAQLMLWPADLIKEAKLEVQFTGGSIFSRRIVWTAAGGSSVYDTTETDVDLRVAAITINTDGEMESTKMGTTASVDLTGAAGFQLLDVTAALKEGLTQFNSDPDDRKQVLLVFGGDGDLVDDSFDDLFYSWVPRFTMVTNADGTAFSSDTEWKRLTYTNVTFGSIYITIDWDKINDGTVAVPHVPHYPARMPDLTATAP